MCTLEQQWETILQEIDRWETEFAALCQALGCNLVIFILQS
jgi:hypothetical protein